MTVLFPDIDSPQLERFIAPFGRMMLAFGRAHEAVVELTLLEKPDEAEAREYVSGTADLPKKMRRLFREKIDTHWFGMVDVAVKRFARIAEERHHLIHGEWWFDEFDQARLVVRRLHKGQLHHSTDVTPERLEEWTSALVAAADDFELVFDAVRMSREAPQSAAAPKPDRL
ncbi:hypothetical protein [Methylobacterium durans]|uniref:Uncharacterized protein n=1 Tax=Methylobacterium durans TaxID=2202825 RepID=A0A2U8W7A9_9HYPH|nr:hypothetical protein [Methylobacterium durans]AWN41984.1 hypothetical protein DK389_17650 [Methylobacterium durans]